MIIYNILLISLLALKCFNVIFKIYAGAGKLDETMKYTNIVIPRRVDQNGDFMTYSIPCYFNWRNCTYDFLHYKLNIGDEDVHIELKPIVNVLSKGFVRENHHYGNKRNVKLSKLNDTQCQYHGFVRNKQNSNVAVSNCAGLMGYIKMNDEFYLIEPAKTKNKTSTGQPHILYQQHSSPQVHQPRSTLNSARLKQLRKKRNNQDMLYSKTGNGPGVMRQMYLETLIVLDKTLIEFHKSLDLDNYILTVLNMAHTLFRDSTFGAPLELVLVRMISLENEDDVMNLGITKDAPKVLEVFKAWANRINPPLDSHPNHHDLAILITRVDICLRHDASSCGLLGLANMASMCDAEEQALLVEDTGLVLGFTIAHEIGHALGIWHDGLQESGCESSPYGNGDTVVMAKQLSLRTRGWSSCSREYLWAFIDAGMAQCLYDEPSHYEVLATEVLPGAAYGVSFQCQSLIDLTVDACPDVGVECENMKCWMPKYGCVETHRPLAEGTQCGERSWCYGGRCLTAGQRPAARDGGWSNWGQWSECSRTCGSGVRHATRSCDNPLLENRGFYCRGQRVKYQICNEQTCPFGASSHRDVQCAEFNSWLYPEDNKTHTWRNYISTSENPCALVCLNELKQLALLKTVVIDGTPCYSGQGHLCIAGQCMSVPCDGVLESEAIEDACGICGGNGTSCTLLTEHKSFKKHAKPQLILAVPVNTHFAVFEEVSPTKANFFVKSGKSFILKGNKFGTIDVNKMHIWLGYVRHQQEMLRITGPVTETLQVFMQANEDVTVKYSIAALSNGQKGKYGWQYIEWSECSKQCGLGTHSSLPQCIEASSGLVDNKYCTSSAKPKTLTRMCQLRKCEARWQIGEWSGCDCSCPEDIVDERLVLCVVQGGEVQEERVVADTLCLPPKPRSQKPCSCQSSPRPGRTVPTNRIKHKLNMIANSVKEKLKKIRVNSKTHHTVDKKKKIPHIPMSKIIDRNHLKNVKAIQQHKLIQDYENLNEFKLTLELDEQNAEKTVPDFLRHKGDNKVSVHGKEAVKIIQKFQEHHHSNSAI